ncbi:MAG: MiaB/RimO family radical SAM methylthiotransferase [Fibrobacter sp.]|uniref:MiaB/RimO family radical SAM methylthiotransferase n=1 Tax=Fibrobacter sp. TaxID=35828 RepID=UPI0025C195DB|nr:MiaB/RimO family radical SAM methylthiotransferase [Fibrobacter sp.]MBQ9225619.1 MiaB/RimO family radical SAM methylthiotransferase [Fibrobacter sp.]
MSAENPVFAVLSQGCAANFGDGERIARALAARYNARVVFRLPDEQDAAGSFCTLQDALGTQDALSLGSQSPPRTLDAPRAQDAPDAIYLNVCTVKGNAGALKLLRTASERFPGTPLFITGCAPKDFREEAVKVTDKVVFTSLEEITSLEQGEATAIESNVLRESPFVGIVNIEEGCLDACAFCSTHLVKGRLKSYAPEGIVEQVKRLVADGCTEIQLTGQDCACYGFDIGTNLATLTQSILVHVPGNYKIRLGMGNPRHVCGYAGALLECFQDNRVYKFMHVPVQSGSDRILKAMNRRHTASEFRRLASEFNKRFPLATLSTDLIVGFPGETESDFRETLRLLEETRPTVCNITRFVARPGTAAARMEADAGLRIPDSVKHERSARLAEAFQKIARENNALWVGKTCDVVVEKPGHRAGTSIARNEAYRPVALAGDIPAGTKLQVRITDAEAFALISLIRHSARK